MNLGQFSLSLAVRDVQAAYDFYRGLGLTAYDDHLSEKWIILRNGDTLLGLFEGMFEANILSFHTADIDAVRKALSANGFALPPTSVDSGETATYLMLSDPDGNQILIDQIDPDYQPTPGA